MWTSLVRPSVVFVLAATVLLGLAYPLAITGIAQVVFPEQANGSVIRDGDRVLGSRLVGREFTGERWFHGRPSATSARPYDASASTGSNLGPTNPALVEAVAARVEAVRNQEKMAGNVPVDLVTTSASGLDPDLSPAAALLQARRVAAARGLAEADVAAIVDAAIERPILGLFGAPHVNVWRLNLALERR